MECFGICSALGSPLTQQDDAIVVSQWQRALRQSRTHSIGKQQPGMNGSRLPGGFSPPAHFLSGSIWMVGQSLTLSLCSMNSAKFKRVCVTSAMSCEVRANSMLLMSSSCWSSFSSDQQDTNAALKRSLKAERSGKRCWKCLSCLCLVPQSHLSTYSWHH